MKLSIVPGTGMLLITKRQNTISLTSGEVEELKDFLIEYEVDESPAPHEELRSKPVSPKRKICVQHGKSNCPKCNTDETPTAETPTAPHTKNAADVVFENSGVELHQLTKEEKERINRVVYEDFFPGSTGNPTEQ